MTGPTLKEELQLDRIARLCAQFFQAPLVVITLDQGRQFRYNMEQNRASVQDFVDWPHGAGEQEIFEEYPSRVEKILPYCTGHLIRDSRGCRLGSLCLFDARRRNLTDQGAERLRDFAELTEKELMLYHQAAELAASSDRLRLFENAVLHADDAFLITEASPVEPPGPPIIYANAAFTRESGYTLEEIRGKTTSFLHGPRTQKEELARVADAMRRWKPTRVELINYRKNGSEYWVELNVFPIADEQGVFTHWVSVQRDASKRKQAEASLRASEARYRALFDHHPQPMWLYDRDSFRFLDVNQAAIDQYGYTREEFLAMTIFDIRPAEDVPLFVELARRPEGPPTPSQWRHRRKDGSHLYVEIRSSSIELGDRHSRLIQATDVTQKRSLEDQLRQAQKMEAIGQLAGGVAHDFNNLLTVINGYAALLMERTPEGDSAREDLAAIRKAGDRAAALTQQLLAFSRKQVLQPRLLTLNRHIEGMRGMLLRLIRENIDLRVVLSPDLGPVEADPTQLEQVILNLVINAQDAIRTSGVITIETRNVELDDVFAQTHVDVAPGPYVLMSVRDTGMGMTRAVRQRIFEPFFTTKEKGKGTGLGLPTVYGIVTQSGGHLEVETEDGMGSEFRVYLPRVARAVEHEPEAAPPPAPARGVGTILLVEDDEQVRVFLTSVLKSLGYDVLVASNGEEAVNVSRGHDGPLDLLISDVIMPKMGGHNLALALLADRNKLKVLYLSGYTEEVFEFHGGFDSPELFLAKPFSPAQLARKVREALES